MTAPGTNGPARLAATMLEVALAEVAEPERLRRGRRYARQGAVIDLVVNEGSVSASVQGSRSAPYDVQIRVTRGGRAAATPRLGDLVPKASTLRFDCTCPDWEEACKHAVAVMTEFAERVAYDPSLLTTWRGAGAVDAEEQEPAADEELVVDRSELDAFLGAGRAIALPAVTLTPLPHIHVTWDEPWSGMLHDALRVLSRKR